MNKIGIMLLLVFWVSATTMACNEKRTSADAGITTVKKVRMMNGDTSLTLEGKIIKKLPNERYMFSDGTGEITAEIERDVWMEQAASPTSKVRIHAKVNRNSGSTELNVQRVEVLSDKRG